MDLLKKPMLIGLGMLALTQEKVKEMVDELVKKGEITKEERLKVIDKVMNQIKEQEKEVKEKIAEIVKKTIMEMGLPTKEDLEKILKKLDEIEKKISASN
jgi:polyhydroxyalkanoate synthesis regulator phasin